MGLGWKILVPQAVLLALLIAVSVALLADMRNQEYALRETRAQLERGVRFARMARELHAEIAVQALSYRQDSKPRRLHAIASADTAVGAMLRKYRLAIADPWEMALVDAVIDGRGRTTDSRGDFLQAIEARDAEVMQAAFDRWRIHRNVLDANLDDLFAFNLDRFNHATEAMLHERLGTAQKLLAAVALALAVTVIAFVYVRRILGGRLRALTQGILRLAGDRNARVPASLERSRDEIGEMAHAFNNMAAELAGSHEEIEALNRDLEGRVTRRTRELEAANKELEAFAYSVSHDLRAPLRAIDGFSQALLEDYAQTLDDDGRDSLRRVRNASQHMGQLIDDMLKLSRATRTDLEIGRVNLSKTAESVVSELRRSDPGRSAEVHIAPGVVVQGDARLLHTMMENLLSNAWKFTSKKGATHIEFSAQEHDGEVTCHVRDNGAGFDMAFAHNLFVPFHRLHRASDFPGNGIGLATVKRIVARLGGRVWAEGAVERGATFHFTLPQALEGATDHG